MMGEAGSSDCLSRVSSGTVPLPPHEAASAVRPLRTTCSSRVLPARKGTG